MSQKEPLRVENKHYVYLEYPWNFFSICSVYICLGNRSDMEQLARRFLNKINKILPKDYITLDYITYIPGVKNQLFYWLMLEAHRQLGFC